MSHLEEAKWEKTFKWGLKKRADNVNKDFQFYESFTFNGVKYFLYDSVFIYQEDYPETHIGKLVEIYETPANEKVMKVVWFFRPNDMRNYLNDYEPRWNEIFLASGKGKGLSNINPLEAVRNKCNVLCASNDWRNPQASEEELKKADYIFYRTFDVAKLTIEESFPEEIDGVKVEHFFNRKKDQALVNPHNFEADVRKQTGKSSSSSKFEKADGGAVKAHKSGIRFSPVVKKTKKSAFNRDEQWSFANDDTAIRLKTSSAKCTLGESSKKIIGERDVTGRTGKSSISVRLGLEKAVGSAVNDGSSGVRMNPVVKESTTAAANVDKQVRFTSDNRKKIQTLVSPLNSKAKVKEWTGKSSMCTRLGLDEVVGGAIKDGRSNVGMSSLIKESGKAAVNVDKQWRFPSDNTTFSAETSDMDGTGSGSGGISNNPLKNKAKMRHSKDIILQSASNVPFKKRKLLPDEKAIKSSGKSAAELVQNRGTKIESLNAQGTRRLDSDRSWFKKLPWEKRLQRAHAAGTLVCLENLDPSYTSSEVEDLVWHALHHRAEAKMLQRNTLSSPHNGKALVIFKSKDVADFAISELRRRCLMLADRRPVVGSRGILKEPGKPASFVGHQVIDKMRHRKRHEEMRKAVSTSHSSQPNTIEYDMAIQWIVLQDKFDQCWEKLHEQQAREIHNLRNQLKMNLNGQE